MPRTREQEPGAQQHSRHEEATEKNEPAQTVHEPGRSAWTEVAARAGAFLKDVGKALKEVSAGVYQRLRDWWTQPLELAPEIDRNPRAAWASPPPAYTAYEQAQPSMWNVPQGERIQAQGFNSANEMARGRDGAVARNAEAQRKAERVAKSPAAADTRMDADQEELRNQAQPALIARNNFQFADFTGARFESIRIQDNDFRYAVLANAQFPPSYTNRTKSSGVKHRASGPWIPKSAKP